MGGFTPINAKSIAKYMSTTASEVPDSAPRIISSAELRAGLLATVASDYLGRGDPDGESAAMKQNSGALRGPGSKKGTGRGKKRTSESTSENSAKRRRTSDLPITTYASQTKKKADDSAGTRKNTRFESSVAPGDAEEIVMASIENPNRTSGIVERDGQTLVMQRPVQVITPATSMDTFHSSSPQTSLDALRSSGGYTATVYRGRKISKPTTAPPAHSSQTWCSSTIASSPSAGAETSAGLLHRRNGNSAVGSPQISEGARQQKDTISHLPASNNAARSTTKTTAPAVSNNSGTVSQHKSISVQSYGDEDFLDDDDDDVNLLRALADSITAKNRAVSKCQVSPVPKQDTDRRGSIDIVNSSKSKCTSSLTADQELLRFNDEDESELLELTENAEGALLQSSSNVSSSSQRRSCTENEERSDSTFSDADKQPLGIPCTDLAYFESPNDPVHKVTNANNSTATPNASQATDQPKPILRAPNPNRILDRSPIAGVTKNTLLRSCFRLGEAFNAASQAARTKQNILLELYARVTSSYREGRKQHFIFRDLYHDNCPWLEGEGEAWRSSKLWDADWKGFVGVKEGGMMCRVIGRMKREEPVGGGGKAKWKLEVLSIWEAGWEDVEFVAGIYA